MSPALIKQFARFALVGGLGLIVDLGLTLGMIDFGIDALVARLIAIAFAMLTTWRLNRALTFGASSSSQTSEGMRYFAVAISVALVNYAIFAGLLLAYPGILPALAIAIAVGFATILSFCGYRFFAFKTAT